MPRRTRPERPRRRAPQRPEPRRPEPRLPEPPRRARRRSLSDRSLSGRSLGRRGRSGLGLLRLGLTLRGPGRLGGGLGLLSREGLLDELLVAVLLAGLHLADPKGALGTGQALELLPVAGDGQQVPYLVGRLCADGEPVQHALGVDVDERRLQLRVVPADLLDGAPVPLGAGVGDDDAVIRFPDLAQALQSDLDSHGCALLPRVRYVCRAPASGEWPAGPSRYRWTGRTVRGRRTARHQAPSIGSPAALRVPGVPESLLRRR